MNFLTVLIIFISIPVIIVALQGLLWILCEVIGGIISAIFGKH